MIVIDWEAGCRDRDVVIDRQDRQIERLKASHKVLRGHYDRQKRAIRVIQNRLNKLERPEK